MEQIFFEVRIKDESSKREDARCRTHGRTANRELRKSRKQRTLKVLKVIGEIIESLAMLAGIFFALWFFASWLDIVAHNSLPNPVYQPWNFFTMLM